MIDQNPFSFSSVKLAQARADIKAAIDAAKENDRFTGTVPDTQIETAVYFLLYLRHSVSCSEAPTEERIEENTEPSWLDILPPTLSVIGEFVFELWYGERSLVIYIDEEGIIDFYPFEGDTYQWTGMNSPTHNQYLDWLRNGKE